MSASLVRASHANHNREPWAQKLPSRCLCTPQQDSHLENAWGSSFLLSKWDKELPHPLLAACPPLQMCCFSSALSWTSLLLGQRPLVWPYHIELHPPQPRDDDCISDPQKVSQSSHWCQHFYHVNKPCLLTNLPWWSSYHYCISQCFGNCWLAPWGRETCILYWFVGIMTDVMASIHAYHCFVFPKITYICYKTQK